jgi:hypothetical protein
MIPAQHFSGEGADATIKRHPQTSPTTKNKEGDFAHFGSM